jgi:hypothetical protein
MTIDRETPNAPASGTPKMSVIQGGKGKTAKGKTKAEVSTRHRDRSD